MKLTKLSLVAALAVSTAMAGGDIAPVEPTIETPATTSATTINGKLTAYYITDDSVDLFDKDSSAFATAVTLDVSHKFNDMFTANFTALGYVNLMDNNYFEGLNTDPQTADAFFNVANLTATFGDTTLVLGRQLLESPMVRPFDWLLAPGSFEAYTVVNSSIENLTLVGTYIREYRGNNTGSDFLDLTDIGGGNNWALGAVYDDKAISGNLWYYNVDAGLALFNSEYTQVYADVATELSGIKLAGQIVSTSWDTMDDSMAYGIKVSGSVSGFDLMAAYVKVDDNIVGFVDNDSIYTSMWNNLGSLEVGNAFKIEAATEFSGLSVTADYAYYDNDYYGDGHEFDLILGYDVSDSISLGAIYSNTKAAITGYTESNALEFIATYKF